jgi:hypothetical protein
MSGADMMWQKVYNIIGLANLFCFVWFVYLFNVEGRRYLDFDTLSASLTLLQITMVIGGVLAFNNFKQVANDQATKVATESAEKIAREVAESTAIGHLRTIQNLTPTGQAIDTQERAEMIASEDE